MRQAPTISIVIAVWNRSEDLAACLSGIRNCQGTDGAEIVVVDDGSHEDAAARIAALAVDYQAKLIRLERRGGPAAARNRGAHAASGEVLLFLDSDVVPQPDCLALVERFFSDPNHSYSAVIGSYDSQPHHPGMVSQYRNLVHAHVHLTSAGEVNSFWAGCGAVRRDAFFQAGSFDEAFQYPSVEDVEFGGRLHLAGYRILLDPGIQVTHRKRWTLQSMLFTDISRRSIPWTMLALGGAGLPRKLNFTRSRRASVFLAALSALCCVLALLDARFLLAALAAFAGVAGLNVPFFRWLRSHRSRSFTSCAMGLHWLHYLTQGVGFVLGAMALLLVHAWCRFRPRAPLPEALRQLSG